MVSFLYESAASGGRDSRNTQPRICCGFHHSLTYSFLFGHEFLFEAIPNTMWSRLVGDETGDTGDTFSEEEDDDLELLMRKTEMVR